MKKAADFLKEAGIGHPLMEKGWHPDVEAALRDLKNLMAENSVDELLRKSVRTSVLEVLKEGNIPGASQLVDAALKSQNEKENLKDLQGKSIVLAEPEPWPDSVDGAQLLNDIVATFQRFVVLPDSAAPAIALWSVHTHALEAAQISPILGITSPEKRCAKTLNLEILEQIVTKPLPAANVTTAAVFRAVEKYRPALLIDEADSFLRYNEELRGILNSGHRRSTAIVVRTVGDDHEPRTFSTWCPKAIALIGKLPGTLEDRSIIIHQRRKAPTEKVERWRSDRISEEIINLRRKAARWVNDHLSELKEADPETPRELNDRAADNWRPLLAIADEAGGDWPQQARAAALALSGETSEKENSARIQLLSDIRDLFDSLKLDRLSSSEIIDALVQMEERPWPEWKKEKPLTARQLASLLSNFGVKPKVLWIGEKSVRGYERSDLEETFSRYIPYIPPILSVSAKEPNSGKRLSDPPKCKTTSPSYTSESTSNPHGQGVLTGLTLKKGGKSHKKEKEGEKFI